MISKLAARACPALLVLGCGGVHAAWLDTRAAIEEFAVDGDFESAFALDDQLLAEAAAEFGETSGEVVEGHLLLASLYRQERNLDDAELHLLRAIEVLEVREEEQSTSLILPLLTLGDTYLEAGSYPEAIATYEEARAIGRREFGLLNFQQIEIIDRMTAAAQLMNDRDQARALQREAVAIVQRVHGEDSPEFVDAQFRLAAWYLRTGQAADARRTYLAIESVAREQIDNDPLLAIRILRTKAVALRNANPVALAGRTNPMELEQALEIAASLEEPNPLLEAEILRDIGDWHVILSKPSEVAQPYMRAWALLGTVDDGFRLRHEWFGPLTLISAPPFESRLVSREPDAPWGRIEIHFTLDTQGRPTDIRITQSEPPGLLDDAAIRQILSSRFRPRMDGGRVITSEATIGWDFQYHPPAAESVTAIGPPSP